MSRPDSSPTHRSTTATCGSYRIANSMATGPVSAPTQRDTQSNLPRRLPERLCGHRQPECNVRASAFFLSRASLMSAQAVISCRGRRVNRSRSEPFVPHREHGGVECVQQVQLRPNARQLVAEEETDGL